MVTITYFSVLGIFTDARTLLRRRRLVVYRSVALHYAVVGRDEYSLGRRNQSRVASMDRRNDLARLQIVLLLLTAVDPLVVGTALVRPFADDENDT